MPRLYRSGNFVIADDGTDQKAFPCAQSYYTDEDDLLNIFHDMRGLSVSIGDPTTWDNAPTGSTKYTLDTMRTFLRDNLMLFGGSPARYELKDTGGVVLESGEIASGTLGDIVAGDNTITLNTNAFLTLKAEEDEDIELVDQDDNPITPDSVVGAKITVSTGGTVQGLTLMKTGQTTQRVPFDDGAIEMGRLTDHVTLNYNNPFGNTKRFTDKTDAGTFSNSVAYDWSTWNESDGKVLAYYFGDGAFRNLTDHCAQHVASTIDGLANDWYLTNFTQMINIVNGELIANFMLNYAPFNLSGRYYWLSSSGSGNGTATDLAADGWLIAVSKTNTYQAIFVRECTVVGTTIT